MVEGGCEPGVGSFVLTPAELVEVNLPDEVVLVFLRRISELEVALLCGDLQLVARKFGRLGRDVEDGLELEGGKIVERDIPGAGAKIQRQSVFRVTAASDDQASIVDVQCADFPGGCFRGIFALRCPALGIIHIPEEVGADVDRRFVDHDARNFIFQEAFQREAQLDAAHGNDLCEWIVGREDLDVCDFDGLFLAANGARRLREGNIF